MRTLLFLLLMARCAAAQVAFQTQNSETTADLRGIHAVSARVAWASGTRGTILRTLDGGAHWMKCAVPPEGEKLDFRGVWAWDEKEAMAMASGPGELSRLYLTTDGCATWTELARNHDKEGFWDGFAYSLRGRAPGVLVGDPVGGHFETDWLSNNHRMHPAAEDACVANEGEGAFAASNTSVFVFPSGEALIGTGGTSGARVLRWEPPCFDNCPAKCKGMAVPIGTASESSGIFSLAFRDYEHGIAVGGDYKKPSDSARTAAFSSDGGHHWTTATESPHGYRSAVAWDSERNAWIAVGTNGADVSRDDGKTWQAIDDGNWNAISVPFAVGPGGRIAKMAKPLK